MQELPRPEERFEKERSPWRLGTTMMRVGRVARQEDRRVEHYNGEAPGGT
jgi:hypothetical protein